jgi:hypothetical protein
VLAPEWTAALADAERKEYRQQLKKQNNPNPTSDALFKGSDFEEKPKVEDASEPTPFDDRSQGALSEDNLSTGRPMSGITDHTGIYSTVSAASRAETAFEQAGLNKPFTVQPFREELNRIISVYLVEESPRQLNLSGRERHALLKAVLYTTHPSAFREVVNTVEYSLRRQSHPNFIRWAICNGNKPRVTFARGLGIFLIVAAIVTDILITISSVGRGWRAPPIILMIIGFATLFAAWKGMCVVLHGLHHQHVRPWELFTDQDEAAAAAALEGKEDKSSDEYSPKSSISLDSLMSSSTNSFEDEPWVAKYKRRNVVRQIFDREIWIKEPALKQIQDTIFLQAILLGTLASAIIVAIFVAVPSGHLM